MKSCLDCRSPFGKELFEQWYPDLPNQGTEAMKPDQKRNDFVKHSDAHRYCKPSDEKDPKQKKPLLTRGNQM